MEKRTIAHARPVIGLLICRKKVRSFGIFMLFAHPHFYHTNLSSVLEITCPSHRPPIEIKTRVQELFCKSRFHLFGDSKRYPLLVGLPVRRQVGSPPAHKAGKTPAGTAFVPVFLNREFRSPPYFPTGNSPHPPFSVRKHRKEMKQRLETGETSSGLILIIRPTQGNEIIFADHDHSFLMEQVRL